jgi:hypothetical protein
VVQLSEIRPLPLNGWEVRGDLACLLCGRIAATAQGPRSDRFSPSQIRVREAGHETSVRRMRCPHCAGRLWFQDTQDVYVDRRPLSRDDLKPRRGRPPKVVKAS